MTKLSRLTKLAFAPEATSGTYLAPSFGLPFDKADYEDVITELRDESYRNNDTVLQGLYPGAAHSTWSIDVLAYPDLMGHWLRAMIGPDTVTAGVSTTLAAAVAATGAVSISTTASIPAGSTIRIGTGTLAEYAITGAPTGAGPYTIPITSPTGGLTKTHLSGATVVSASTHTFKQDGGAAKRTFSLSVNDTTNAVRGYSWATLSDLALKIDPKGAVSCSLQFVAMPGVEQADFTPSYVDQPPILGWQWAMTNAGAASTRGLTLDYTIKRAVEPVHGSTGVQAPREIFAGALTSEFSYSAVFENRVDLELYERYRQMPTVATLTQPVHLGGCSLALTMSKSGYTKGTRDLSNAYVQAAFSGSGIYNATDGGAIAAELKNFVTAPY
ncbi:hypothetical protein [Saccharothrix hoggarensis]|uniref:Uncharacterized protein n=1 Tax=Saccharothrix hoggarensis TaxID=913853 RepID=A0ABW3QHV4_9PSEU